MDVFDQVWDVLAEKGMCDERGGCEYERVRSEWERATKVERIAAFIMYLANANPAILERWAEHKGEPK